MVNGRPLLQSHRRNRVAKYKTLGKKCVEDLMTLKDGMSLQQNEVNQLVGKVSIMPLSKEAYRKLRNESIVSWEEGGIKNTYKNRDSVKQFVKCAKETRSSSNEEKRERQNDSLVTSESDDNHQTDETTSTSPTKKSKDGGNVITPTLKDIIMSDDVSVLPCHINHVCCQRQEQYQL